MIETLHEKFRRKITTTSTSFIRSLMGKIAWDTARLIGIKGQRGVGKTTLLLQHIKIHYQNDLKSVLYVSLDDLWFSENKLTDLAAIFVKKGGKVLFLDEVHKYPLWSQSIKNIYDDYPELKLVFTGSSLLEILNSRADLSRRAVTYTLEGLSFREYIGYVTGHQLPIQSLQNILSSHTEIASDICQKIKPLAYFDDYLRFGYYPYFKESEMLFQGRLQEVINFIL
ncbi:MAG: AAA family ATPase, partial [Capnocytophaga sp.]|nr:AAA family ATPase [Capnocytophaga sp.]